MNRMGHLKSKKRRCGGQHGAPQVIKGVYGGWYGVLQVDKRRHGNGVEWGLPLWKSMCGELNNDRCGFINLLGRACSDDSIISSPCFSLRATSFVADAAIVPFFQPVFPPNPWGRAPCVAWGTPGPKRGRTVGSVELPHRARGAVQWLLLFMRLFAGAPVPCLAAARVLRPLSAAPRPNRPVVDAGRGSPSWQASACYRGAEGFPGGSAFASRAPPGPSSRPHP